MATLARLDLEPFVAQLIEERTADFRQRHIPADFLQRKEREPAPDLKHVPPYRRRKFTIEEKQIILHLYDHEHLTAAAIAERFSTSQQGILRILDARKPSEAPAVERRGKHAILPQSRAFNLQGPGPKCRRSDGS